MGYKMKGFDGFGNAPKKKNRGPIEKPTNPTRKEIDESFEVGHKMEMMETTKLPSVVLEHQMQQKKKK